VAAGLGLAIALLPVAWAGLLVLGALVGLAVLLEPRLGLLLLVFAIPFGSIGQVRLGVMNLGVSEAILALTLGAWLMRLAVWRKPVAQHVQWPPLSLPLAILLGAMLLSVLGTFSLQYSIKEIVKWLEVFAVYLLVATGMDGAWRRALVLVFLFAGSLAALHGIYQFLFRVGPEEFVLFGRFMRAFGTFDQPNPYGGYLGLTLPLAGGLIVAAVLDPTHWRRNWRWLTLVVAAASGVLMLVALIMSWSRGAWLGFAAAALVMGVALVVRSGRGAVLMVVLLAVIAYAILAGGLASVPPSLVQRFSDFIPYLGVLDVRGVEVTDANFSVLERMAHWQSAVAMWTDRPWLGVGIGNYEPIYSRYALPLWPLPLGHAHNYYLNIAAEAGLFGLLAYLLLWVAALLQAWRAARRRVGWEWGVALGVLGVIVHLSVHNVFDNLYVHAMYLQIAMLLGLLALTPKGEAVSL
jgi:O-antigen ligase